MFSTTLEKVAITDVARNIHVLVNNRLPDGRPVSVMLHGTKGVAKTTMVHDVIRHNVAELTGQPCVVIHELLGTMESTDLRGIPFPITKDGEGKPMHPVAMWTRPDLGHKIDRVIREHDGRVTVILLFDEWGQASADLQKAAIPVLAEGLIGDYKLPPQVWVWGTSNFQDDGAGVSKPLSHGITRVLNLPVYLPATEWVKGYALPKGIITPGVMFVERNAAVFEGTDRDYRPPADGPDCNYRSFTYGMNALKAFKAARGDHDPRTIPDDGFSRAVLRGYIGQEMADQFFAIAPLLDLLPDPKAIYRNWETAPLPSGTDAYAQYPLQSMLLQLILAENATDEQQLALLNYTTRLTPDLASGVFAMVHAPQSGRSAMVSPQAQAFIAKHVSLFMAISQAA